ncbi:MAG: hypothetical protein KJ674_00825, partial [Nanoarchaeota archaeon]|nr:hypothetical protein [Nanoarchaeota archaeon]
MKNKLIILLLILLLGITLRVYAFSQISSVDKFTLLGDPATYYDLGENIEQGKGPVIDFVFQFWHRADFGENDALWEPVLPYTLAILFFLFGPSILLGKILVFVF